MTPQAALGTDKGRRPDPTSAARPQSRALLLGGVTAPSRTYSVLSITRTCTRIDTHIHTSIYAHSHAHTLTHTHTELHTLTGLPEPPHT